MKNKKLLSTLLAAAAFFCFSAVQAAAQADWNSVAAPKVKSILPDEKSPGTLIITYEYETALRQDKVTVDFLNEKGGVISTKTIGRTKTAEKTIEFTPPASGTYSVRITGMRTGQSVKKGPVTQAFKFSYPLDVPVINLLNFGGGDLNVSWSAVQESESYTVTYIDSKGKTQTIEGLKTTDTTIKGLPVGKKVQVKVTALRGSDKAETAFITKTIKAEKDRIWKHTFFGQSTKKELNRMEMIDPDNLKFKLYSCTFDPATQNILEKGGKFTSYHDGVSFYYTEIDAANENFELTATFTIDYINIAADGQEGFGIVAMDHIGNHGVFSVNHYTNSAAVLATKMEERFGDVKKTSKDTVGARFVSGITREVIAKGDAGIAEAGKSEVHAYSYDQSDLVKAGDVYRITLKKSNTGYHAIFRKAIESEDTITEFIMYGPEKLLQLDKNKVYVGFAVARGCNATVSDVEMIITDPRKDPPAVEEPPELIPLITRVDAPAAFGGERYPFVFYTNSDGILSVKDSAGKVLVKDAAVKALTDYSSVFRLVKGFNDYIITFSPDNKFRPGPHQAIAVYNKELKKYEENYNPVTITHSVINMSYAGKELYVSPSGDAFGKGTKDSPLDLITAINYALPGQPIIMLGGKYYPPSGGINIERGNSGTAKDPKVLKSDKGVRPVIDFSSSKLAMQVWADWWIFEGFDITNSPPNVKGVQIAGHNNIARMVNTYLNGDTGMQISGSSVEPPSKWPTNNLIENCTSWGNCDPSENNADGFAAKLTCGAGNVFRGCIAYSNIDDGWDLYSKIETGPIEPVVIENSIAYKNGTKPDGSGNGDGNGFKLGGDGIAVKHILKNSIAFNNGESGITCNSDPAIILINNTSFGNTGRNINLYGKGASPRMFVTQNNLSMDGGGADEYKEMPELASPDDFFWTGAQCLNSEGKELKKDIFVSTDYKNIVPGRKEDGSIDMKGLFQLNAKAPKGIGADLNTFLK